jgi:hypothetical protein
LITGLHAIDGGDGDTAAVLPVDELIILYVQKWRKATGEIADCGEIHHKSHKRDKRHRARKQKSLLCLLSLL